jgi:flagellar biosynthesis protein FlhG
MATEASHKEQEGKIWAIAGGKGGTGKSFIVSGIGSYLALKGESVVLVDVDIGGANLHSFFGINRPKKSLTDFFENGTPLSKLALKLDLGNMYLISGDIHSLASDNIRFTQKLKLFRHIMKFNKQYVLIDLGSGSHNNTLDTFLIADKMVVVLEPEIIAVENLYHFIKNALFRKLKMVLRDYGFKEIVEHMWEKREKYNIKNLRELIDCLKSSFSYIGDIIDKELAEFKVNIILNKVRSTQDVLIGASIKSIFLKYLGLNAQFVGYIEYDDAIWRAVRRREPFMLNYATSRCGREIEVLTENLLQGKEIKLLRSG